MIKKNTILIIVISLLFGMLLMTFLVKPTIIGYGTYQEVQKSGYSFEDYSDNLDELKTQLVATQVNLSSYDQFNSKLFDELEECNDKYSICETQLIYLRTESDDYKQECEEEKAELTGELLEINDEIRGLENEYSTLARNSAKNICCKLKVDDPGIDSYNIINNKISCSKDGEFSLDC